MGALILALNGGSSSLKYGAFEFEGDRCETVAAGTFKVGGDPSALFDEIASKLGGAEPAAIGHRIVHGGPDLFAPIVIDADVIAKLQAASAFAPLHGPAALDLIALARHRYPSQPHVACFDTGFHQDLPPVAAVLPVPKAMRNAGIRRYGFHGLSCQSIIRQLGTELPERLIVAHLGSGASVTAIHRGRSIDTSMGLTPCGGLVMATRSGDVDPGLLLYLLREHATTTARLEDSFERRAGMLGISDYSGDMQTLKEAKSSVPEAQLAIDIFCRSAAKAIAAMIVSLGGLDMLVFCGGIGEHDADVRDAICGDLAWAGVPHPRKPGSGVRVLVFAPEEEEQIARDASRLISSR